MHNIVKLFKSFDKYKDSTDEEIHNHILPAVENNQFRIFYNEDGVYSYMSWAFLNKEASDSYKLTSKINMYNWNCGDIVWLVDVVVLKKPKEITSWAYEYFRNVLKIDESINWLRLDKENNIYRVSSKFKREYHHGK